MHSFTFSMHSLICDLCELDGRSVCGKLKKYMLSQPLYGLFNGCSFMIQILAQVAF